MFTDEKFNLDCSDRHKYFWADKAIPENIYSRRQNAGGGVMEWDAISSSDVPIPFFFRCRFPCILCLPMPMQLSIFLPMPIPAYMCNYTNLYKINYIKV